MRMAPSDYYTAVTTNTVCRSQWPSCAYTLTPTPERDSQGNVYATVVSRFTVHSRQHAWSCSSSQLHYPKAKWALSTGELVQCRNGRSPRQAGQMEHFPNLSDLFHVSIMFPMFRTTLFRTNNKLEDWTNPLSVTFKSDQSDLILSFKPVSNSSRFSILGYLFYFY